MSALKPYRVWLSDLAKKGLVAEQPAGGGPRDLWQFSFTGTADGGGLPSGGGIDVSVFDGDSGAFGNKFKERLN